MLLARIELLHESVRFPLLATERLLSELANVLRHQLRGVLTQLLTLHLSHQRLLLDLLLDVAEILPLEPPDERAFILAEAALLPLKHPDDGLAVLHYILGEQLEGSRGLLDLGDFLVDLLAAFVDEALREVLVRCQRFNYADESEVFCQVDHQAPDVPVFV